MLISTISLIVDHDPGRFHDWDAGNDWWFWGPVMMAIWIALIVGLVLLLVRRTEPHRHHPSDRAREILAERFARGELTPDEYHERLQALDR